MGRLSAAAGRDPQRGHPRPAAVSRRRLQGPRRREDPPRGAVPGRHRRGGEQALRPAARRPRRGRTGPLPDAARPDTPLPVDGGRRVGQPDTVGHPDERRRVAPVRPPRPPARLRLLRDRPRRGAAVRQRGRPAPLLPAAAPELLHASAGRRASFLETALAGGSAPRAAGRPGYFWNGVRAGLPRPRRGPGRRRGRRSAGGARGRPDLPVPAAVRALRRGPGAAARKRHSRYEDYGLRKPVRERHRAQDGRRRRLLGHRLELLRPPDDAVRVDRRGRRVDRAAALQRRPVRPGRRAAAWEGPPVGRGGRPHRLRPEPRRYRRRAAFRQLPGHVRPAARVDLRAPAGARAGQGRARQDRRAPQQLRPQGQRQLLHAAGARRPDRRPDAEAAGRGASRQVQEEVRGAEARPQAEGRARPTNCAHWTRPRPCST